MIKKKLDVSSEVKQHLELMKKHLAGSFGGLSYLNEEGGCGGQCHITCAHYCRLICEATCKIGCGTHCSEPQADFYWLVNIF